MYWDYQQVDMDNKTEGTHEETNYDNHDIRKVFYSAGAASVAGAPSPAGASSGAGVSSAGAPSAGAFSASPSSFFSSSGFPGTAFGVFLGIPRNSSSSSSSFAASKSS